MDNQTSKSFASKVFWIVLTFIFFELLLIAGIEALIVLSEYKLNINLSILFDELQHSFTNLGTVISNYWAEKNPIFIIGTIVFLIYTLILHKGKLKKDGWETETDNTYHGSSRWAKEKEIFDSQNFLKATKKDIQSEFKKSLKERD